MAKLSQKAGPIMYIIVCIVSLWFFYWFAAVYHWKSSYRWDLDSIIWRKVGVMKSVIAFGVMLVIWTIYYQAMDWFFMKIQALDYFFMFH